MKIRWIRALVGGLCLLGWSAAQAITVFVSLPPQKFFVEHIGGTHVETHVLVGPGQNYHTYEPSPRQMAALARADMYIQIGAPFEEIWLPRLREANPRLKLVDSILGITPRQLEEHGEEHGEQHADGDHHAAGAPDPHYWTNPLLVKIMAGHIRDALAEFDPPQRAVYEANYQRFSAELEALDAEIRALLQPLPQRRFMVFHPSWGYFADAYGLRQIPIETAGKEPGAKTLAGLINLARREQLKTILAQQQFNRRNAELIAEAIGGNIALVDPLAENYMENLRLVAQVLARK
jgi:zinc transport system substrate-binding protein